MSTNNLCFKAKIKKAQYFSIKNITFFSDEKSPSIALYFIFSGKCATGSQQRNQDGQIQAVTQLSRHN